MKANSNEDDSVIFLRQEIVKSEPSEEDEWDDSQLIKEYDRAIAVAKRKVIAKVTQELGLSNSDVQDLLSDCGLKKKKKNKKKKSSKTAKWEVGSACRAVYSEDLQEYEAEIISMIDEVWCVVKFIGYNNEEKVLLEDLTPSLGKAVRKLQIEDAIKYNEELDGTPMDTDAVCTSEEASSLKQGVPQPESLPKPGRGTLNPGFCNLPPPPPMFHRADPHFAPPPPPMFHRTDPHFAPPPPPMFHRTDPHFAPPPPPSVSAMFMNPTGKRFVPREVQMRDEALDSVLMSWYMCGYYTGYYQRDLESSQ